MKGMNEGKTVARWEIGKAKRGLLIAAAIIAVAVCVAVLPALADPTPTPTVGACVSDGRIMLADWTEGSTVHVTVGSDASGTLCSGDVTMDDGTWKEVYSVGGTNLQSLPLAVGEDVTATCGATTKTLHVVPLTEEGVNLASNTVTGTADPETTVTVHVWNDADEDWSKDATADPSGVWAANFTGIHTLVRGDEGGATVEDTDGDWTEADWRVPNPNVWVVVPSNQMQLEEWPAGSTVHVVLDSDDDLGNGTLFSADVDIDGDGNGNVDQDALAAVGGLRVGQYVTASQGSVTKVLHVGAVSVRMADTAADTVGGTAAPGSHVEVWVDDKNGADGTAGASGSWTIHIPDCDIVAGDHGMAVVADSDGDATRADWNATGLTIKAASSKVKRGKSIVLSTSGSPTDIRGEWVRIEVKKPGTRKWSAVTRVVVPRTGVWKTTYTTTKKMRTGVYSFRVVYDWCNWADLMGSTATVNVTLRK